MTSSAHLTRRGIFTSASNMIAMLTCSAVGVSTLSAGTTIDSLSGKLHSLETQANALNLPHSGQVRSSNNALNASNFYLEALPRLVDLADRSLLAKQQGDFSDLVAAELSNINLLERSPPDQINDARAAAPAFLQLKDAYSDLFAKAQILPQYNDQVRWYCNKLKFYKDRYAAVANQTTIPWYFIGIVHALEASFNFLGHLHNGDPLTAQTVHVPSGRPKPWLPPSDWASSAIDALTLEGFTTQSDWSVEHILYLLEKYNGFGYRSRGVVTPYLWSFSNNYTSGKFTADGRFDRQAVSQQCGAAVMLKYLKTQGII